ncbi:IPT/TIG domain-containing protein [Cellulomonas sp. KRMCY2]|uniref:IPT/TIG domain-containing protein n=1 Tax=Cellulomonas sp. KRMCY2 TaxID=1304865 RepID=UPI00045E962D|nr:IPT/TIG domain-containing protein [Cellulomonas sp. KRMCY2]
MSIPRALVRSLVSVVTVALLTTTAIPPAGAVDDLDGTGSSGSDLTAAAAPSPAELSVTESGPVISTLSPPVAVPGASVVVDGAGFAAELSENTVTVNGQSAVVTAATTSQLEILVPAAAGSGPVAVTAGGTTVVSELDLYIVPSGFTPDLVAVTGRLVSGEPVTVALGAPNQIALLTVPLTTDDRLAVQISGSTFGSSTSSARVSVRRPDGSLLVGATGFGSSGLWIDSTAVPVDGTYTILVDPQGVAVGSASVTAHGVPADVVVDASPGGAPVVVGTSVPGQNGAVVFSGVAGQRVALSLVGSTFGTASTALTLVKPDGSVLVSASFAAATAFVDAVTLPVSGDYKLVVNPAKAAIGQVEVSVLDASEAVVAGAADGGLLTVATSVAGQNGAVVFSGVAGQRVAIEVVDSTYGISTSSLYLSLVGPGGTSVVVATKSAKGTFIEPVVLAAGGEYRVVVDPTGVLTGTVGLRLHGVPADVVVDASPGGAPVVVGTSVPGQNGAVVFSGVAGQRVALSLVGSTFGTASTALTLVKPDGSVLVSASFAAATAFVDAVTLPVSGDYKLVVNPAKAAIGQVEVSVLDASEAVVAGAADGGLLTVATSVAGQNGAVVFSGVAGQRVAIEVVDSTYGISTSSLYLSLVGPGGTSVVVATKSAKGTFIEPVVLAAGGEYRVVVDPTGVLTGTVGLRLHGVPADVVVDASPGGAPVVVGTSVPGQNGAVVFSGVAGQRVALSLVGSTFGTASTALTLVKPDGSVLVSASFAAATAFVDAVTLPVSGDYKLVVNPAKAAIGQVEVSVLDASEAVVAGAADGGLLTVATSVAGQNGAVVFSGVAGQRVAIEVVDSTYGISTSSLYLSLVGPGGTSVVVATKSAKGTFIEPVVLAAGGEYRVVVDPTGVLTGTVGLRLHGVPADVVVDASPGGAPVVVGTSVPGQNGAVVFSGVAGQRVALSLVGSTFGTASTALTLVKPDGSVLVSASFAAATAFVDAVTLPVSGDYKLVVNPAKAAIGQVEVEIVDVDVAVVYEIVPGGEEVTVETTSPGKYIRLDTELTAGVVYGLRIDAASGRTTVTVRNAAGNTVVTNDSSSLDRTIAFTAPSDGIYTITVDPLGAVVGSWRCALFSGVGAPKIGLPLSPSGWYSVHSMTVTWPTASAETIVGYAVVQDDDPATEPTETTHTAASGTIEVPEGESWVHVRGVLADGTLGPTAHARIMVDTVPPELGPLTTVSHPDVAVLYGDRTVQLTWTEPEDASGIAGYSIGASKSPSSAPDATFDTVATGHAFELDSNGLWYLRVRPVDIAGNVGEAQAYEVNVDGDAPAAPLVTGTHEDGVESSSRTLVAEFAPGDDDVVSRWSAVVDQDPGTVPNPAAGHVEPRLVATLEPGVWWLHVSAGDALGRWGEPTHVQVVVTATDVAVLQAADSWVWTSTSIGVACEVDVAGMQLVTFDGDGAVQAVGPLVPGDGACLVTWDPTTLLDGQRVWPDGAYDLAVADADGNEVSARVPVTVAVTSTAVDRVISEYRAGIISATELVDLLVRMLTSPTSVPTRYLAGASEGGMTTAIILQALGLLDPELRDAFIAALTPEQPAPTPAFRTPTQTPRTATEGVPDCVSLDDSPPGCVVNFPGFSITYMHAMVGVPDDFQGIPPRVQTVYDALAYAKLTFEGMGFATPDRTISVNLVDDLFLKPGGGVSLPSGVINMNVTNSVEYYLPMHEYFHQVQYEYFNGWDTASEPYWWMEATAEWAAHRAQEQLGFPGNKVSSYAANLKGFLSSGAPLHIAQSAVLSPGGNEYGAFVLPEYLEDRFGGDEAIRWTWDRIGDGYFGIRPLDAVDDYVQTQGSTYAEAIEEFRLWTYVLADTGSNIGFSDDDAKADEFWRQRLMDGPGSDNYFRRVTATAAIDPVTGVADGSVRAAASNTAYIEIDKPAGVGGTVVVTVTRKPHPRESAGLSGARASVIPVSNYPTLCGNAEALTPVDAGEPPPSLMAVDAGDPSPSLMSVDGGESLQGSFQLAPGCSTLTLAITNTSKDSVFKDFDWSVAFEPTWTVLSNGVIEVGVNRNGSIISDGVGVRRAGDPGSDVLSWGCACAAWGIADGTTSGWADTNFSSVPQGMLGVSGFAADGRTAAVDASLAAFVGSTVQRSLDVQLSYRPSASPSLYAIDVQVERTAMTPTSGRILFETALDFDVPPDVHSERVTWDSATGEVPAFVDYLGRNGFHNGNPLTQPSSLGGPVVLGEPYGPSDQGTVIRLDLGELAVGDRVGFTVYVGVATGSSSAAAAVDAVDPALYALAEPGAGPDVPGGVIGIFGVSDLSRLPVSPTPGPDPV